MTLPPLAAARAAELVARIRGLPILVVGDVMLDRFIVGRVTRISPEAPVPVVRFESEHTRLGGAANVAANLAALGARVALVGIAGSDRGAALLRAQLAENGIDGSGLVEDGSRPTVEKVRVVTERNQQVARIDYEADADADAATVRAILAQIARLGAGARAIVVSDYLKGAITSEVTAPLAAMKKQGTPFIVDPKVPHLSCYAAATLVTPNHHEAEAATNRRIRSDAEAREAAHALRTRVGCDAVLITRGEHGMWLSSDSVEGSVPAVAREVADVTGAGDTVTAALAASLAAGATLAEAAQLANQAAGIVVGKFGPATVSPAELLGDRRLAT